MVEYKAPPANLRLVTLHINSSDIHTNEKEHSQENPNHRLNMRSRRHVTGRPRPEPPSGQRSIQSLGSSIGHWLRAYRRRWTTRDGGEVEGG